ncbi:MAG: phage tail protein [Holophagales bacterium]|nr:phage tail protein [Holophagales bacterium]
MRPWTTFDFEIDLRLPGSDEPLCRAEFSDCDGLEMSHETKTLREGGDNARQVHLAGPVTYGQLTLKRGMTADLALWDWFSRVQDDRGLRAQGTVRMLSSRVDLETSRRVRLSFLLEDCLPIKIKAPSLAAKDGGVAIEEMQIAYARLRLEPGPGAGSPDGTAGEAAG